MGSDRARNSYNPGQLYRSVVMQQGRVTLEADWNEAQTIAGEQLRRETLDIVGPSGTWRNDNGYAVSLIPTTGGNPPSFDFTINSGYMYVGGERAYLPATIDYSAQPTGDWMDFAQDPDWVATPTANPGYNEFVYLLLREQEVSAVEDSDLKDIALGGPDTAQRTRFIQHIVRRKTNATDCPSAQKDVQAAWWEPSGYKLDPDNMRVESFGRLQVGFINTVTTSPCNPAAQGGYLGADNQMIRVQISNAAAANPSFLWGYDDASFLYEVAIVSPGSLTAPTTLKLNTAPVDAEHIPQNGQAVELLLPAAQLSNGQYVAAATGQVFILGAAAFTPGANTLTLPPGIDTSIFGTGSGGSPNPPQLYLRIWQGQSTFTAGTAEPLSNTATGVDTGLSVTLTTQSNEPFRLGDYWAFAVRPANPDLIYPERYTAAPQPPDGPREWICPLAVIQWSANPPVATPCTNTFLNLVQLSNQTTGGCCSVFVSADDHNSGSFTIQDAINELLGTGGRVCLGAGTFNITSTIELSNVTLPIEIDGMGASPDLEETTGVTVLSVATPASPQTASVPGFLIDDSTGVTIQDLQINFAPGYVGPTVPSATFVQPPTFPNPGIMIQNSYSVTVQRCTFSCTGNTVVTNAAIALGGFVFRISVSDCLFEYTLTEDTSVPAFGAGYGVTNLTELQEQTLDASLSCMTYDISFTGNVFENVVYGIEFDATCYHLAQVNICGNEFGPCAAAAIIAGSGLQPLFTSVVITDNLVVECFSGFACGLAARIAGNTILLSPVATPGAGDILIGGIVITPPVIDGPIDGLEITGNRIVGGSGWGILVEAQTSAAEISHNIIEASGCGGIGTSGVDHLSITNNQLLRLIPNSNDPGVAALFGAFGILALPSSVNGTAVQAGYIEVTGNAIKDLATDSTQATVGTTSRFAIAVEGFNSTIIANNHLINIGPANAAIGTSAGIYSVAYPFDRFDISNNVIRRNDSGTLGDTGSSWYGIDISGFIRRRFFADAAQAGQFANQRVLQVSDNAAVGIGFTNGFFIPAGGLQNINVSGNYIEAAGGVPAVNIDVSGACIFTGNHCVLATAQQNESTPVAEVDAASVVACNNVLQNAGKSAVSLDISTSSSTANSFTALGNITSAPIRANNGGLSSTLLALNATL